MLTQLFKMPFFKSITVQMNKSALLGSPLLIKCLGGITNGVSLEGKMDQSYHRTSARCDKKCDKLVPLSLVRHSGAVRSSS
jgi:hypothetical protein